MPGESGGLVVLDGSRISYVLDIQHIGLSQLLGYSAAFITGSYEFGGLLWVL